MTYKQYATKKAKEVFNLIKHVPEYLEHCTMEHWLLIRECGAVADSVWEDIENGVVYVPRNKQFKQLKAEMRYDGEDYSDENVAYEIIIDEITSKLDKLIEKALATV